MKRMLIQNGKIVSGVQERKADILIEGNRISQIKPRLLLGSLLRHAETQVIDATNCYVFPGFIDANTHLDTDLGTVHTADDFETGTKAALVGGTTSIIDFAIQSKGDTLSEALDIWHKKARNKSSCNYGFHLTITDWQPLLTQNDKANPARNADTRAQLKKIVHGGVSSVKVYMANDTFRLNDPEIFEILSAAKELAILVGCHCENGDMVNRLIAEQLEANHKRPSAHPASRPPAVEAEAISRFLALAQLVDIPVLISTLSTKQGLEQIKLARKRGQKIFVETCPQYLTLIDSSYRKAKFEGAKFVCIPPLRKKQDKKALWKDLARHTNQKELCAKDNSLIQIISTDHCALNFAGDKELGKKDFSKIPSGLPGIQDRAQLIFTGGNIDLPEDQKLPAGSVRLTASQFSALMSENVAKIFGLHPDRGSLEKNAIADITIWDPTHTDIITTKNIVDYTPYEGIAVRGIAKYVILGGELCAENGKIVQEHKGLYLFRQSQSQ